MESLNGGSLESILYAIQRPSLFKVVQQLSFSIEDTQGPWGAVRFKETVCFRKAFLYSADNTRTQRSLSQGHSESLESVLYREAVLYSEVE